MKRPVRFVPDVSPCAHPARRRTPFTLIELLIVIAVIAILAGLLVPAVSASRKRARLATCIGNLHEVSLMHLYYADASDSFFCPAWDASFDSWATP